MNPTPGIYRYASPRAESEGWRIGVARHLPRGVRREDWGRRDYFDLWLPLLAPSASLVKDYLSEKIAWSVFARRYKAEMKAPECRQMMDVLALLSLNRPITLGCFCEDETRCHRSLLRQLITERRDELSSSCRIEREPNMRFASPVCYAQWDESP